MKRALLTALVAFGLAGFVFGQAATQTNTLEQTQMRLSRAEKRLNDWPDLARYHDANMKLSPPAKGETRVVFMGDSITDSWDLAKYFPGKPYVNRGISGQTTPQMLIRFRPDVVELRPKVVVILAGTNDLAGNTGPTTLEAIEGNLRSMVELARANGIRVVLASVMPVSDYNKDKRGTAIIRTKQRPPEKINELNRWIKEYSAANRLVYLDYFSAMADEKGMMKAEISNDGLHPNAKGYELIAPLAEAGVRRALKVRPK